MLHFVFIYLKKEGVVYGQTKFPLIGIRQKKLLPLIILGKDIAPLLKKLQSVFRHQEGVKIDLIL